MVLHLQKFQPHPALHPFIDHFYILRTPSIWNVQSWFPDGTVEALFCLGAPIEQGNGNQTYKRRPEAALTGLFEKCVDIRPTGRVFLLGTIFRPGKFHHLLPVSSSEVKGRVLDLSEILPGKIEPLMDTLQGVSKEEDAIELLQSFFLQQFQHRKSINFFVDKVIHQMREARGNLDLKEICSKNRITSRHLRRLFNREVGLSPRTFRRLIRISHVVQYLHQTDRQLIQLAYELGYCDNAHLSNDFKQVASISPRNYLGRNNILFKNYQQRAASTSIGNGSKRLN